MKTIIIALMASAAMAYPAYAQSTSATGSAGAGINSSLNAGNSGLNANTGANADVGASANGGVAGNNVNTGYSSSQGLTTNSIDQDSPPLANSNPNIANPTYSSNSTLGSAGNPDLNAAGAGGGSYQGQTQGQAMNQAQGQFRSGSQSMASASETITPSKLSRQQIRELQEALNQKGFDAGHVDGIWGPHTRTAVKNFQTAQNMRSNGRLDQQTLSALGMNAQHFAMNGQGYQQNGVSGSDNFTTGAIGNQANANGSNSAHVQTSGAMGNQTAMNGAGQNGQSSNAQSMNGQEMNGQAMRSEGSVSAEQTGSIPSQNFDLKAFQNAQVSLDQAVNTAQGKLNGQVIGAAFTKDNGKPAFRVRAFNSSNNKVEQAMIDASSGQMIGNVSAVPTSGLDQQEQQAANAASSPQTSLTQAVQAATQQSNGGKAVQAMLTQENGQPAYAVTVASNGSTQTFQVDAQSGKVQPVSGSGSQGNAAGGQTGSGG